MSKRGPEKALFYGFLPWPLAFGLGLQKYSFSHGVYPYAKYEGIRTNGGRMDNSLVNMYGYSYTLVKWMNKENVYSKVCEVKYLLTLIRGYKKTY